MKPVPRIREDDAYDDNGGLHPVWLANNFLRRRKYDECVAICSDILAKNPYDQVRLFELPDPKCRLACNPPSAPLTSPPPPKGGVVLEVPRADAEELDRRRRDRRGGTKRCSQGRGGTRRSSDGANGKTLFLFFFLFSELNVFRVTRNAVFPVSIVLDFASS